MKKRLLILILSLLAFSFASAQSFDIQISNALPEYHQGETTKVSISVKLTDADLDFENAVIFLNVVEIDAAQKYPQAAHKIFAAAKADDDIDIFKKVYSKEELLTGLATSIDFTFKDDAAPLKYALVIQVFEGKNTNPHRLANKHRIGFKAHKFDILTN